MYSAYLDGLFPYSPRGLRENVGRIAYVLFLALLTPFLLALFILETIFTKKDGNSNSRVLLCRRLLWRFLWNTYEIVWRGAFGEGEIAYEDRVQMDLS